MASRCSATLCENRSLPPMTLTLTPCARADRRPRRPRCGRTALHDRRDLLGRTSPVLCREGIERQIFHAATHSGLNGGTHRLDAGDMPLVTLLPSCVAQRPLPSMIMATWRGMGILSVIITCKCKHFNSNTKACRAKYSARCRHIILHAGGNSLRINRVGRCPHHLIP